MVQEVLLRGLESKVLQCCHAQRLKLLLKGHIKPSVLEGIVGLFECLFCINLNGSALGLSAHKGPSLSAEAAPQSAFRNPIKALRSLVRSRGWNIAFMHALCAKFCAPTNEGSAPV